MNCNKVGKLIHQLRKEKNLTQKQIADKMNISDKTISKWERGQGYPDISFLKELAKILGVSIDLLLDGEIIQNELVAGNMNKVKFYVCTKCNNIMTATGSPMISCCGKVIEPLKPKKADKDHVLEIRNNETELFVTSNHVMKKDHYITFIAYVVGDKVLIMKQYPEWNIEVSMLRQRNGILYFYCINDGLYYQPCK